MSNISVTSSVDFRLWVEQKAEAEARELAEREKEQAEEKKAAAEARREAEATAIEWAQRFSRR